MLLGNAGRLTLEMTCAFLCGCLLEEEKSPCSIFAFIL